MEGDFVVVGVGKKLDGYGKLPSKPQLMGKSKFNCLVALKKFHIVKLVHGLKAQEIVLRDQPMTRRDLHFLTMTEFCYNIKKRRVIQNIILVFHRHPQPTPQCPYLYIEDMWKKMKLQHKYSKVLFALLKMTINDDFFKGKIHMNLPKDPPFDEFNKVFEKWISRFAKGNPQMDPTHLKLHYRVDPLLELNSLKDIVDGSSRNVDFMIHKSGRTFAMFSTTNLFSEDPYVTF